MNISHIRGQNRFAGHHFFDAPALRFFNSHIEPTVYQGPGGVYFVTSEQFVASNGERFRRMFTVRQYCPVTADILTVGPFNEQTEAEAIAAAKQAAT